MNHDQVTITDINHVYANGIHCGIKQKKKDLAYIYIPEAVGAAGVYTQNLFAAPCILYNKKLMKRHLPKAIVINSGNANAGTGKQGQENVKKMAKCLAEKLDLKTHEVCVASTGIIGEQLPMDVIESGIDKLCAKPQEKQGQLAAEAIMTTDTFSKSFSITRKVGKKSITVSGIAKGSGMIAPNMATMLAYIVTNANIPSHLLDRWLKKSVDDSFNMISVDTDTSTSDMVMAWSTGEYKIALSDSKAIAQFQTLLTDVCIHLAKMIIKDGEGATKLIEAQVEGAVSVAQARKLALNIIDSPLIKTAIHGEDPNWGRLIMAIGKDETLKVNPNKVIIKIGDQVLFEKGNPVAYDEAAIKAHLAGETVLLNINLQLQKAKATAWGCDLSKKYVDINTDYN